MEPSRFAMEPRSRQTGVEACRERCLAELPGLVRFMGAFAETCGDLSSHHPWMARGRMEMVCGFA